MKEVFMQVVKNKDPVITLLKQKNKKIYNKVKNKQIIKIKYNRIMTKEQFLKMKNDFKKVVEETKIRNKYVKAWWNLGFKTEEEYNNTNKIDMTKVNNFIAGVLKNKNGTQLLYGDSAITHWAYYCAKHKLEKTEREQYLAEQFSKIKEERKIVGNFIIYHIRLTKLFLNMERLYVLIDKTLEPIYACVQGGHAVAQWLLEHPKQNWNNSYLIYLSADVEKWKDKLEYAGYDFSEFREPDLNNKLTSIAVKDSGKIFKKLNIIKL